MAKFAQNQFNRFVIENRVIGFFEQPITLKSGRKSFWYVNWRTVSEDAFLLDRLSDFVVGFIQDLIDSQQISEPPNSIYGVPEGATKVALLSQLKWARQSAAFAPGSHALPMGRGKPKEHGMAKDKYFLGIPRGNTFVVEDVTTTGGSLLTTLQSLKEAEVSVGAAIGLTNRMELRDDRLSVADAIGRQGVKYFHMSDATELLKEAARQMRPSTTVLKEIEMEFKEFGVKPVSLV